MRDMGSDESTSTCEKYFHVAIHDLQLVFGIVVVIVDVISILSFFS
jgi:hypothetical protein